MPGIYTSTGPARKRAALKQLIQFAICRAVVYRQARRTRLPYRLFKNQLYSELNYGSSIE